MIQSKSLAFLAGVFAVGGALLVAACSDDDPAPGSTGNDAGSSTPPTPGTPPATPNNPPPTNLDAGTDAAPLTNVALGGECTTASDDSAEWASRVCRVFGGGGGGGGGGGSSKTGTLCTVKCADDGAEDADECTAHPDVLSGKCNNQGYCSVKP